MLGLQKFFIIKRGLSIMVNKNSDEINAVIDCGQKITAFGGFWWLKKFMERLGVGSVFAHDYGL
jgi:hypothetical protein